MNFARRAYAFILRKKGQTVSLFLLVFVVSVFLISCFTVLNASETLAKEIRTSLGAVFYIRASTQVRMGENGEVNVTEAKTHITQKDIDEIMKTGEIKYCNPINYGFARSNDIQFIPGEKHSQENNMGKVTSLRFSALAPDFMDETVVLTKGKHITQGDHGKILISEELADANRLSVGDTLTLTHASFCESGGAYIDGIPVKTAYIQVCVSGIYKLNKKDASVKPTPGLPENELYASLDVLHGLQESEPDVYTGEVDFYIIDPARLESIIRHVRSSQSIDWGTHFIRTNDFQYSKIADQLSALSNFAKILLALISVISGAVLTLLLTLRMRSRVQEAGILLAAGISKWEIMAGFLTEVLSVAIIAFLLSYPVSCGVTSILGHNLLRELHPNLLNDKTLSSGMNSSVQTGLALRVNKTETLLLYACQFLVLTVSTLLSSIIIIRLKPKEILSRIS